MSRRHWQAVINVSLALVATAAATAAESSEDATRTIAYHGVPVAIELPLNEEIRVHLDESIEVGVPVALASKLNVSSVHGVVYLTAVKAFASHRLALKASQSGRIALLDAATTSIATPIRDIFLRIDGMSTVPDVVRSTTSAQLMRYIARMTLATRPPKSRPSGVKRVVVAHPQDGIYRDFAVVSTPLAAWGTDRWLALAVELQNQSSEAISLNPRDITGVWRSVAFQHVRLLPKGKRGATTVMFLVGAHDAFVALRP